MSFLLLYSAPILIGYMFLSLFVPYTWSFVRPVGLGLLLMMMLGVWLFDHSSLLNAVAYFEFPVFLFDYVVFAQVSSLNAWVVLLFLLAFFCLVLYASHVRSRFYWFGLVIYGAGALGAVLTRDWLLFVGFWELVALGSMFLIAYDQTKNAFVIAKRYLMMHLFSGLCLLIGVLIFYLDTGSWYITRLNVNESYSYWILIAFLIKVGFVGFHGWLVESYPSSSPISWPALSVFSTKLGIFCLVRSFFGWEIFIDLGLLMLFYPVFFALMSKDVNRILSYSLLAQLGVMFILIGIGTPLALNALMLHLFVHVFYKLLFFMVMGILCKRYGWSSGTEVRLFWQKDRILFLFLLVASMALIGMPLTGAFVSKGLIFDSISQLKNGVLYGWVVFGTALPFLYSGVRLFYLLIRRDTPVFVDRPYGCWNMYLSAIIVCVLVVFSGFGFYFVEDWLPYSDVVIGFDVFSSLLKLVWIVLGGLCFSWFWYQVGWMDRFLNWRDVDQFWSEVLLPRFLYWGSKCSLFLEQVSNKMGVFVSSFVYYCCRFSQLGFWSSLVSNVWLVFLSLIALLFLVFSMGWIS